VKKWAHELDREFSKEDLGMASKYMKCSTSLVIKEMQSKTTLRFHLTPVRMAIIKVITTTNAGKDVAKQNSYTLLVGMQISTTTMESSIEIPQKTRDRTAI
jgi:hypothetical protein